MGCSVLRAKRAGGTIRHFLNRNLLLAIVDFDLTLGKVQIEIHDRCNERFPNQKRRL